MTNSEKDMVFRLAEIMDYIAGNGYIKLSTKSVSKKQYYNECIDMAVWELKNKVFPVLDLSSTQLEEINRRIQKHRDQ